MEIKMFVWLLMVLADQSLGYNLATNGSKTGVLILDPSSRQQSGKSESLFGWSVHKFEDNLFVGAPQWESEGAIFRCSKENQVCSKIPATRNLNRDPENGWLGASITGHNGDIYTCAPFLDIKKYYSSTCQRKQRKDYCLKKSAVFGGCYKYHEQNKEFKRSTEFKYKEPFAGGVTAFDWYQKGSFGLAATVADDGNLVVGAPITTNFFDGTLTDVWSGTIVKYSGDNDVGSQFRGKMDLPKADYAPFSIQIEELRGGNEEMLNNYKLAGMALAKGYMFGISDDPAYIIGAPKADNNLGKVYVCVDCFKNTRGFEVKPDHKNRQLGERFGQSVTACDVNGDGKDDVIVGAPYYTDGEYRNQEIFNTGRVHVFLMRTTSVTKAKPPTLQLKLSTGSRFGAAMACLGDTDGDGYQEVVVGAPDYSSEYGPSGAIFIFRGSKVGLQAEPSQKIYSSSLSSNGQKLSGLGGFGISLFSRGSVDCPFKKDGRAPDCSQCSINVCKESKDCGLASCSSCPGQTNCVSKSKFGSKNGLTVGAHRSEKVIHMQFRKVTRVQDTSSISFPSDIDPKNTNSIVVKVVPKVYNVYWANMQASQDLTATVSVTVDRLHDRITNKKQTKSTTISAGSTEGKALDFTFIIDKTKIDLKGGKPDPIPLDVTVTWKLADCIDTQGSLCSMLDPAVMNGDQSIIRNHKTEEIFIKTGCDNPNKCRCEIAASVKSQVLTLVAGENDHEHIGDLILSNHGFEPAFSTLVTISLSPDTVSVANIGDYCRQDTQSVHAKGRQIFVCPYIEKMNRTSGINNMGGGDESSVNNIRKGTPVVRNMPITLHTDNMAAQITKIQMNIEVTSECAKAASSPSDLTLSVEHKWEVTTRALYPSDEGDKFNWDWRNDGQKTKKILQTFQVTNKGPSTNDKGEIFVFIPKSHALLSNHVVNIETPSHHGQTVICDDASKMIPEDIKAKSCSFSGNCVIKSCNIPKLKKKESVKLMVSVIFSLENTQDIENKLFKVITSVLTKDSKNKESFSEYISTLEYRDQTFLAQLTNYWYVLVGVIIGVIFITIICLVLYKCNVFNRIRIYKDDLEEVDHGNETEMIERVDPTEDPTFVNEVDVDELG